MTSASGVALLQRFSHVYHAQGMRGVLVAIRRRLTKPTARSFSVVRDLVTGATGLEIGGPSRMFARGGLLPAYPHAGRIDNCNYAAATLWERDASDGDTFFFAEGKAPGHQYVAEATNLSAVPSERYDFVLSSHALEHTANPLKALVEWRRVLKSGGALVLVVPHKDGTFDHRRPVTKLAHLQEDFQANRGEDDLTHLPEVLALHDTARDPSIHTLSLAERMQRNLELRSMHHHVFNTKLAVDLVELAGFTVLAVEPLLSDHIIVVARKGNPGTRQWSRPFRSPFPSDRQTR
jgi:SAM-dependent methyltransferase